MNASLLRLLICCALLATAAAHAQPAPLPPPADDLPYVAKPGDTMIGIARRLLIDGRLPAVQRALQQHNGFESEKDADRIGPGRTVRIPSNWLRSENARVVVASASGEIRSPAPLKAGAVLAPGQEIGTGKTGQVVLKLTDGSTLTLKPGSTMSMERSAKTPLSATPDTVFNLTSGRAETEVVKRTGSGARFEIRTPVAVAAVRGTRFRVSAAEGGAYMTSEVLEGRVEVADTGRLGRVSVDKDFGTRTNAGAAPVEPRRLLEAPRLWGGNWLARKPGASMRMLTLKGAVRYRVAISQGRERGGPVVVEWDTPSVDLVLPELSNGEYFITVRGIDDLALEGRESGSQLTVQIGAPQS